MRFSRGAQRQLLQAYALNLPIPKFAKATSQGQLSLAGKCMGYLYSVGQPAGIKVGGILEITNNRWPAKETFLQKSIFPLLVPLTHNINKCGPLVDRRGWGSNVCEVLKLHMRGSPHERVNCRQSKQSIVHERRDDFSYLLIKCVCRFFAHAFLGKTVS